MHQILGLKNEFFDRNITPPNIQEILGNTDHYLQSIKEEDRVNLFYTAHHCVGLKPRDFAGQDLIPFDIDDVEAEHSEQVADAVCKVIGADPQKVGVVRTGNGIQLVVQIESPITNPGYFATMMPAYKILCLDIDKEIKAKKLSGHADFKIWTKTRFLRLPGTINRKPKKGADTKASVMRKVVEPHGWTLEGAVQVPGSEGSVTISDFKNYPTPDVPAVLAECGFLAHCKENPDEISEAAWYAMLGVLGHMPAGAKIAHDYSEGHSHYSEAETAAKLAHAVASAGPRTCENIDTLWNGCKDCPHYKTKLKSPIMIQGEEFIATESTCLWNVTVNSKGDEKRTPAYEDIVKYWKKKNGAVATGNGDALWTYNKEQNIWEETEPRFVRTFVNKKMDPKPSTSIIEEAFKKIQLDDVMNKDFFERSYGFVNLANGVYEIATGQLLPFNKSFGFRNNLGYNFDADAKADKFIEFLGQLFPGQDDAIDFVQEYMGYIISGDPCWIHKAAIFLGDGRNGKSTLNDVIRHVVGSTNVSSVPMKRLGDPTYFYDVSNRLVNLADENAVESMNDSDTLKNAVSGGDVMVKKFYSQPYSIKNRTKFIFNCNSMPTSRDTTEGLYRRLVILSFKEEFDDAHGNVDVFILDKLLEELPGIFNFAMDGYRRLKKTKRFTETESSRRNMEIFQDAQNDVEEWFEENIAYEDDAFLTAREAYKSYIHFCDDLGKRHTGQSAPFYKKIADLFEKKKVPWIRKVQDGVRSRGYGGVKIKVVGPKF